MNVLSRVVALMISQSQSLDAINTFQPLSTRGVVAPMMRGRSTSGPRMHGPQTDSIVNGARNISSSNSREMLV